MSHSLTQIHIHLVFSTKYRQPLIQPEITDEMVAYFAGILRKLESPLTTAGIVSDHAHLLFRLGRVITVAKVVERVKTGSSRWIKTKGRRYADFHWQDGYGAFSVSASKLAAVTGYIQSQSKHHHTTGFQDELRRFFVEYGVEYDERFVWG